MENSGRIKVLAALAKILLSTLAVAPIALANPQEIRSDQKIAFKFNCIAKPVGTAGNVNCGDGHRIFTERGAAGHILWHSTTTPVQVVNCLTESIDGDWAEVNVGAP